MDHSYFKDRISAYHDRELKHEEAQIMAEHLQTCEECQRLLEELEKFDRMVEKHSGLADDEYWEKAAQRIEAAVSPEVTRTEIIPVKSRWTGMGWKLAAVAASLAVLTFVALHEGEISDSIKQPAKGETPQMMKISLPPVDSLPREEMGATDEKRPDTERQEGFVALKSVPPPLAVGDTELEEPAVEKTEAKSLLPEVADLAAPELVRGGRGAESVVVDTVKTEPIEQLKPVIIQYDSVFPSTQAYQHVPPHLREDSYPKSAQETTKVAEGQDLYEFDLGREVYRDSEAEEAENERLAELSEWRARRDSLQSVISSRKAASAIRKSDKALTAGITADKDKLQQVVDSVSKELQKQDPEIKLLEAHYEIAILTDDRREYEKSVAFLKSYLDKEDSPYKLQAAWYLQQLEETD